MNGSRNQLLDLGSKNNEASGYNYYPFTINTDYTIIGSKDFSLKNM